MVLRGVAGPYPLVPVRRRVYVVALLLLVVAVTLTVLSSRARASAGRCERFAAASAARATEVTGSGRRVAVIGDSWSAGLGLSSPVGSWPSRLPGRVAVEGFSGSGFSRGASGCAAVSFAERAAAAIRSHPDLVVVEGGLNDFDQPAADIRAGFRQLMRSLDGLPVVVVGPASAPARAGAVPRVDALLASLAERYGVPYVGTADLDLPYLDDGLHLTPAGHRAFGDAVAARLGRL